MTQDAIPSILKKIVLTKQSEVAAAKLKKDLNDIKAEAERLWQQKTAPRRGFAKALLSKQEGIDLPNNRDEQSDYKKPKAETLSLFNQSSFTAFASNDNAKPVLKEKKSATISKHLQPLWVHIEFDFQDLDALIIKTKLDTPSLLSQLMELELLGVITQVGGRYQRLTN